MLGAASLLVVCTALSACGSDDSVTARDATSDSSTTTARADADSTATSSGDGAGDTTAVPQSTTEPATNDASVTRDGFGLPAPAGWVEHREAVVGTEFQASASWCLAVEALDSPAPAESGAPSVEHAVVQLCGAGVRDGLGLEEWLTGRGTAEWTATSFGSCAVLEVPGGAERRLAYTQVVDTRAEVAIVVATTPEKTEQRRAEAAAAIDGMQCPTG